MSPVALVIGVICGAIATTAFLRGGKSAELDKEYPVKLFRMTGDKSEEGMMTVSETRVVFTDTRGDRTTMWMADIEIVLPASTGGIVPNGMVIKTKTGDEYQFALPNSGGMMKLIERTKKAYVASRAQ